MYIPPGAPSAWARRPGLILWILMLLAAGASWFLWYLAFRHAGPQGAEIGVCTAVVAFLWVLAARELLVSHGTFSRRYLSVSGSALRDVAKDRLSRLGFTIEDEDRSQSFGATIYRLRWSKAGESVRAEIWSHGNRASVTIKANGFHPDHVGFALGAFEPP